MEQLKKINKQGIINGKQKQSFIYVQNKYYP
jgi:hypothetical protein